MTFPILDQYTVLDAQPGDVYDVLDPKTKEYTTVRVDAHEHEDARQTKVYFTRLTRKTEAEIEAHRLRDGDDPFEYDWIHVRLTEGHFKHVALMTREEFATVLAAGTYELD